MKPKHARPSLDDAANNYFTSDKADLQFVHSGCTVLDCALGGGWCLGRISNVIGDKSTAKTHLAWEALTNFLKQYPGGKAAYRETEAAFDPGYARAMCFPVNKVDMGKRLPTVEAFERDIKRFIDELNGQPGMYVLDSLDALSDEAELKLKAGQSTYGAAKAKGLSALFRKVVADVEASNVNLMIISQIRDKIGVVFGEKHSRSGGHALDFYASHIVKLAYIERIKRTVKGITLPVGIKIKAQTQKNKIGFNFRTCEFDFRNAFGIDDVAASGEWLKEKKRASAWDGETIDDLGKDEYRKLQQTLTAQVKQVWNEVETSFLPKWSKYE
jgi:recombination protein RecA